MKHSNFIQIYLALLIGVPVLAVSPATPDGNACIAEYSVTVPCYSPRQFYEAYGLAPLIDEGYDGTGETIVIIESFGSPTIEEDLHSFDALYHLPDPPSFQVLSPLGTVPFDPNNGDQVAWAYETSLDVEWSHAMAPGANIILMTSPVDETEGIQGLPEFLELEKYALDHHLGNIISQSWGTAENTLFSVEGEKVICEFERFYERAANEHVTVLAGTGDSGSANVDVNGNFYPFPTVLFPASSPYVLAVGGTTLHADNSGRYESETVWNDTSNATGGGVSQYFREPEYQYGLHRSVQETLLGHRGIPDVAYNAELVYIYVTFNSDPTQNGLTVNGGTSEATPQWAGIIADANQLAHRPLGFVNPILYSLGALGYHSGLFHDITIGNNAANGVKGYDASRGWDPASGWGSPNVQPLAWEMKEPTRPR